MRADMGRELVIDALDMAWLKRSPASKAGGKTELIFHSDRGSQYASYDFNTMLNERGITPSMSGKGNCWDKRMQRDAVRIAEGGAAARLRLPAISAMIVGAVAGALQTESSQSVPLR